MCVNVFDQNQATEMNRATADASLPDAASDEGQFLRDMLARHGRSLEDELMRVVHERLVGAAEPAFRFTMAGPPSALHHAPAMHGGGPTYDTLRGRSTATPELARFYARVLAGSENPSWPRYAWDTFTSGHALESAERAPGYRADLVYLALVTVRVDQATMLMSAAFAQAAVRDFRPSRPRATVRSKRVGDTWYVDFVNSGLERFRQVRNALVHRWTPSVESEPLAFAAFGLLCELTPASEQLFTLYSRDRPRALSELSAQLGSVADQLERTVRLTIDVEESSAAAVDAREPDLKTDVLARSGESLSLGEASDRLQISKQALHKRIGKGSALGVMHEGRIVVPSVQFLERDGRLGIVPGLEAVVRPFLESKAGTWSALQFLVDSEPNLGRTPIAALLDGNAAAAEAAARAFLGLDES